MMDKQKKKKKKGMEQRTEDWMTASVLLCILKYINQSIISKKEFFSLKYTHTHKLYSL